MLRVVITGFGAVSPYGFGVASLMSGLYSNYPALTEYTEYSCLQTKIAGKVPFINIKAIPREIRRTMSRMSVFAYLAGKEALAMAKVEPQKEQVGVALGSTLGSPHTLQAVFTRFLETKNLDELHVTDFFKTASHSVAANISKALHCTGRSLALSAACATGLMNIGLAYEAIASGHEQIMLAGGADELHPLTVGTFECMGAISRQQDIYGSRPFDLKRSGIVCSEGAGVLVLESLEHAKQHGKIILGEIKSFAAINAPTSLIFPDSFTLETCMQKALDQAEIPSNALNYVSAHATATLDGDVAEGLALAKVCPQAWVSSLKGHLGHTMAASGALELIAVLMMQKNRNWLPTLNLHEPDPACGNLHHLPNTLQANLPIILKNSFGLGGSCTSLVLAC